MTRPSALVALAALAGLLGACTPGASQSAPTPTGSVVAVEEPTSSPDGTSSAAPPEATSLADPAFGLDGLVLTTPVDGGGPRPVLAWEAPADARDYTVVLHTPDGRPYWAWRGEATEIPVGGLPRLRDEAAGPRVIDGMHWMVTAWDAEGHAVAISAPRPIAP